MLMRPASALWDRHPPSVRVNLSPSVRVQAREGWRRRRGKIINICPAPHSRLQETFNVQPSTRRCSQSQRGIMPCNFSPRHTPALCPPPPKSAGCNRANYDELNEHSILFLFISRPKGSKRRNEKRSNAHVKIQSITR